LLAEKGADPNIGREFYGGALGRPSLDILDALLRHGADPTPYEEPGDHGLSILMKYAFDGLVRCVARLLQDPRVRATVNAQDYARGTTALHMACSSSPEKNAIITVRLLLQAGANPFVVNKQSQTPLDVLRYEYPSHRTTITLLEQYPDVRNEAEKASFLAKVRRLAVAAASTAQPPSYLQARVARAQPLPEVECHSDEERKECKVLACLCQLGAGEGLPDVVFLHVLDYMMPSWDPLRKHPRFAELLLVPGLKKT
jgi:hypothetical protein